MRAALALLTAVAALTACAPAAVPAQNPAPAPAPPPLLTGVQILSTTQLQAIADSLPPGPITSRQIARFDGLSNMMGRRDTSGVNERHDDFTDIFVVHRGRARLRYGGTDEGARLTDPGEWRGGTIRNGAESEIKAGDIVVIPAGVPHHLLLAPGETFYYFVFKVKRQ